VYGSYPVNCYIEAAIARWRRRGFNPDLEPYIFNAEYNPLPAAASLSQINATDTDAGFACFYLTYRGFPAGQVGPPTQNKYHETKVVVQFTRESDGYTFQDRPTELQNIAGVGHRPFEFIVPFWIPARSSWETTASNSDPQNAVTLAIAFHGAKVRLRSR